MSRRDPHPLTVAILAVTAFMIWLSSITFILLVVASPFILFGWIISKVFA